jgi:hypothetical protein
VLRLTWFTRVPEALLHHHPPRPLQDNQQPRGTQKETDLTKTSRRIGRKTEARSRLRRNRKTTLNLLHCRLGVDMLALITSIIRVSSGMVAIRNSWLVMVKALIVLHAPSKYTSSAPPSSLGNHILIKSKGTSESRPL